MNHVKQIIASRRSRVFGPLLMLTALGALVLGIWSVWTQSTSIFSNRLVEVSFPVLMAWFLWEGGRLLSSRRGGVDRIGNDLLLYGESGGDPIRVPLNQVAEIAVHCVPEKWGDTVHEVWVCEALLNDGLRVILSQSDDEHGLKHMAHTICERLERSEPTLYEEGASPASTVERAAMGAAPRGVAQSRDALILAVGTAGVLSRSLLSGGLVAIVVGTILLIDVGNNGALGFMFGPFLGVMGLLLLAIPLTKSVLLEHVCLGPTGTVTHHHSVLGFRWGRREQPLKPGWYVRIRQRGIHGGCLEILSEGRTLVFCGGVHARSRVQPDDLYWIGRFVRTQATTATVPDQITED